MDAGDRRLSATKVGARGDTPEAPAQAERFDKTRAERSTALLGDYVEPIADLAAISGEARVADVVSA